MMTRALVKGPWPLNEIEDYMRASAFPLRLSCVGADGFPRVVSVWFRYGDGQIFCVSHRGSSLVALLRGNNKVGFELAPNEPPYFGVRGQGTAALTELGPQDDTLEALLQRYVGGRDSRLASWLLSRRDEEMLITIDPLRWYSWDYRARMEDIAGAQAVRYVVLPRGLHALFNPAPGGAG